MQAQTNFGICAVRYSNEYIATVQTITYMDDTEATLVELSRQALMDAILAGTKFVTLHKLADADGATGMLPVSFLLRERHTSNFSTITMR